MQLRRVEVDGKPVPHRVVGRGEDLVVVHDPTGGVQAIAYGFMVKQDVTAKQWLEGMPTRFPARFQKVALDAVSQNRPAQAIAAMRFTSCSTCAYVYTARSPRSLT